MEAVVVNAAHEAGATSNASGKSRCRPARDLMTAHEARAQAAREGLAFVKSSTNETGYFMVSHDKRAKTNLPYAVYLDQSNLNSTQQFIGSFATPEEAALAYARATGNTEERTISGHQICTNKRHKAASIAHRLTLICKRSGCGGLVDWSSAKKAARLANRTWFKDGDGCLNVRCHKHVKGKKQKHKGSQRKYAAALREGTRELMEWPRDVEDKVARPSSATVDDVIARAMERAW